MHCLPHSRLWQTLALAAGVFLADVLWGAAPGAPNIVVILADDLGYGDVSCYNAASKVKTPHIDRLAAEGLRFTDAHSPTAVCTPTRYALLTGRYSWRTRLGRGVLNDYGLPLIDAGRLTLPAFLAQHGYRSACVGKWHLGLDWDLSGYDRNWFAPGYRQAVVASTAFVDAQVGRVLAKLAELGLIENTIVLLTGDHGYQLGEHGLWAKQTLFEEGTRVPLIVAAPGVRSGVCAGHVEPVDIYPTLVDLAGLLVPPAVQGRTLQPLLGNPAAPGKPAVFSTMQAPRARSAAGAVAAKLEDFAGVTTAGGANSFLGRSIRTSRYRYIERDGGRAGRQLYDHETDPHELKNLAAEPAQAARLKELRRQLHDHLKQVGGG